MKDHILLPFVEEQFDVLVTTDQGFEYEHNLSSTKCWRGICLRP